jgi:hypothetical protein
MLPVYVFRGPHRSTGQPPHINFPHRLAKLGMVVIIDAVPELKLMSVLTARTRSGSSSSADSAKMNQTCRQQCSVSHRMSVILTAGQERPHQRVRRVVKNVCRKEEHLAQPWWW